MIDLKLPYPPSINRLYATGNGRFYKNKIGHDYFRLVDQLVRITRFKPFVPGDCINFELYLYPNDNRKRDIDAGLKTLLDALQAAKVYPNDSQIKKLYVQMMPKLAKEFDPYCRVVLDIIQ